MSGKHLIHHDENIVHKALSGLVMCRPGLVYSEELDVVYDAAIDEYKDVRVSLISGGGSGHEPSHAGFVGKGMLAAAVCGHVFASPSVTQIESAIQRVTGKAGALLIVKSYTGDRLNFAIAQERCRKRGLKVEMIIVGEDASLVKKAKSAGRRGLAGTVLVHKILGYYNDKHSVEALKELGELLARSIATVGLALSRCTLPNQSICEVEEMVAELGMGIHGESGLFKLKEVPTAAQATQQIVDCLKDGHNPGDGDLSQAAWAILVNNLGSLTNLETMAMVPTVCKKVMHAFGIGQASDVICGFGTYMTSLDMCGISITVLVLPKNELLSNDELQTALEFQPPGIPDAPVLYRMLIGASQFEAKEKTWAAVNDDAGKPVTVQQGHLDALYRAIDAVSSENVALWNRMDGTLGDADLGSTLEEIAKRLRVDLESQCVAGDVETKESVAGLSDKLGRVCSAGGGTSGAVLSLLFEQCSNNATQNFLTANIVENVMKISDAPEGSRTFLDVLIRIARSLDAGEVPKKAYETAKEAAIKTKDMAARAGRSSYLDEAATKGKADPGAAAAAMILASVLQLPIDTKEFITACGFGELV
eukprot:Clim_evm79s108 gene=Clim_evmTU79s108